MQGNPRGNRVKVQVPRVRTAAQPAKQISNGDGNGVRVRIRDGDGDGNGGGDGDGDGNWVGEGDGDGMLARLQQLQESIHFSSMAQQNRAAQRQQNFMTQQLRQQALLHQQHLQVYHLNLPSPSPSPSPSP